MPPGGGRGGRYGGNMMGAQKLPFEIDEDLQKYASGSEEQLPEDSQRDRVRSLFPPYPGGVPKFVPLTAYERRLLKIKLELDVAKRAGPGYFHGSIKDWQNKKTAADFDAFGDQETYSKKLEPKLHSLDEPKKRKWQGPQFLPQTLWGAIGYHLDTGLEGDRVRKKVNLGVLEGDGVEKEDDDGGEDEDEEDEELKDDDFEEDEDDQDNDYNAEQYFDGGEDDYDEGGGDDYGGDDGY